MENGQENELSREETEGGVLLDVPELLPLKLAIVAQALGDLKRAEARARREPDSREADKTLRELRSFFDSEWFYALTGTDGKSFLRRWRQKGEVVPCRMK